MSKEGTKQHMPSPKRDSGRSDSDTSSVEFFVDNPFLRFPFQILEMQAQPIPYIEGSQNNIEFIGYPKSAKTQPFSPDLCQQPNAYVINQQHHYQQEESSACSDFMSVLGCACVCFIAVATCDSL